MLARMFSDLFDLDTLDTVVPSNISYCEDQLCLQTLPWSCWEVSPCLDATVLFIIVILWEVSSAHKARSGHWISCAGVAGDCELPGMAAGNCIWILCKLLTAEHPSLQLPL